MNSPCFPLLQWLPFIVHGCHQVLCVWGCICPVYPSDMLLTPHLALFFGLLITKMQDWLSCSLMSTSTSEQFQNQCWRCIRYGNWDDQWWHPHWRSNPHREDRHTYQLSYYLTGHRPLPLSPLFPSYKRKCGHSFTTFLFSQKYEHQDCKNLCFHASIFRA